MKNSEYFKKEIQYIKNPIIRDIVIKTLDNSKEYIVHIPASSSGKYHPSYALGEGGLMRHIKATIGIANSLIESNIFANYLYNFKVFYCNDSLDYYADCVYSALLLHDICKADDTPEHQTRFDHPLLAGKLFHSTAIAYIQNNDTISAYDKERLQSSTIPTIKSAIESHMGQWNVSRDKEIRLPLPKTPIEHFVHMIDYLASRKSIEFNFDNY